MAYPSDSTTCSAVDHSTSWQLSKSAPGQTGSGKTRLTKTQLREQALFLVSREVDHIPDKRYRRKNAEQTFRTPEVFEYLQSLDLDSSSVRESDAYELNSAVSQMPLLTPEHEQTFFSQMNYLKFRFNQLRTKINPDKPDRDLIDDAQSVYDQAMLIRDVLIRSNIRLVISVTRKFVTPLMPFDELFSDGVLALMQAVEKFDISRGYRFSTYAYYSISRSMYRFTKKLKKRPLVSESLDAQSSELERTDSPWLEQSWNSLSSSLDQMLSQLDPREAWILRQRYVFEGSGKAPTYKTLAEQLGVCNERVRQLEKRALTKLREMQQSSQLEDILESAMR